MTDTTSDRSSRADEHEPAMSTTPSSTATFDRAATPNSRAGARIRHRAGQGDADRLDGQATARRGPPGAARRARRERLAEMYERSVIELSEALSPDLQEELRSLALPFDHDEVPSDGELRVAKAQLVGWLEGLFHGIQATLFAQQFAARQQLEQMRQLPTRCRTSAADGSPPSRAPRHVPLTPVWLVEDTVW